MDSRIIELKKKLIEENIEKIGLISETGSIDFSVKDGLRLFIDFDSKTSFVTKMFSDGKSIWLRTISGVDGEVIDNDVDFMDLESIDYNVSSILDNLLKNK